jgi:hypothetical protein
VLRSEVVKFLQVQRRSCLRRLDRWSWSWRFRNSRNLLSLFHGRLASGAEIRPDLIGEIVFKSTGMGLLPLKANFSQIIQDHIALHFQFTRQFVNPYLSHA